MANIKYVNIKQGTKSNNRFSNGNTLPLVQLPFGFSSFAPQTNGTRGPWFYHPDDKCIEGIRLTHQPSPWINEHGALVIYPQSEIPYNNSDFRWSSIDEKQTVLSPNYLKYYLNRGKTTIELTPTVYGGVMKVNFDNDEKNYLSFLPVEGDYTYKFNKEKNRLYCHTNCNVLKGYDSNNYVAFFVIEFEENTVDFENIITEYKNERENSHNISNKNSAMHIAVKSKNILINIATSYVGYEQAETNLEREKTNDFYGLVKKNEDIWNEYLSRIEIEADEDTKKTFYSCLYRTFLFPHKAYEINSNGEKIHYCPSNGTVENGVRYTDNGFWDTFRTVYPLFSIIAKEEAKEIIEGFIIDYIEGGWLPCWTSMDAKKCMPSTLIDGVIAELAVKGILKGELLKTAFNGMEKHAGTASNNPAYGRCGCEHYVKIGYVPCDDIKESVNLTLDASYGDWCISVVAEILGENEKAEFYKKRSKNYKNLFDKETGFMRGKFLNGEFRPNFNPVFWGRDYTEASAWQTTFAVQHDFEGLAELFGGEDELLKKLDELFNTKPEFLIGGYGFEIHEMSEGASGNWGQCLISNQPSFHLPFIYAHFGKTEKTEYWVNRICNEGFSWRDDGFPGDEDNGTMAAWYIFACLGIYPLCPGKKEFVTFSKYEKVKNIKINKK